MITGEIIQSLCQVYCGTDADFSIYNRERTPRNLNLYRVTGKWDNPTMIFCYGDRLELFIEKAALCMNPFVLVTHNSDKNITATYIEFLNNPKLIFWHAQNVMVDHPKLGGLPIGIANSTWPHGNLTLLNKIRCKEIQKNYDFYFYFSISTNYNERNRCYEQIRNKGLVFGRQLSFEPYLHTLASYKYAICPPGNGVDCHRIWECFYLNVIPIVKRSVFTEKLAIILPCILLDDWNDFNEKQLLLAYVLPSYSSKLDIEHIKYCLVHNIDYFSVDHTKSGGIGLDNIGTSTFE